MLIWPRKTPDEVLDYTLDWAARLSGSEVIQTSAWELLDSSGVDPELVIDSTSNTPSMTTVWLSKGVVGEKYHLTNTITTTDERTMEQTTWLNVVERQ